MFYEALEDNDFNSGQNKRLKSQYFRNNMLAAKFTNWKCKSLIPLRNFMKMLKKNKEPQVRYIDLDKNTYLDQLKVIKDSRDDRFKVRMDKCVKKQLQNFDNLKFS